MSEISEEQQQQVASFLRQFGLIPDQAIREIFSYSRIEHTSKGDILLRADQVCKRIRFAFSGVYRVFKTIEGKDITSYFCYSSRNPAVAAFTSLLEQSPSQETVECILNGQLLSLPYSEWEQMCDRYPELNKAARKMAEFNYLLALERIASLQHQDARYRYENFMKQYPGLLNMIPHHYVASYLGITPESLSRIRKG